MDSDDPTEELVVDITDEVPRIEDRGESNGPPLMWLGLAALLLAGAVGVIVFIGQNRDETAATDSTAVSTTTPAADDSPAETPPLGDPGASATDDYDSTDDSTADTSPPDEASDEATSTDDPSTTTASTVDSTAADVDDGEEGTESTTESLIVGEPTITSSADDFEIMLATSECTTVEWSFAGAGQAAAYSSEDACFDEHLLSPRPEHPLLPATEYAVTASFGAGDEMQVITLSVTTAP